MSAAAGPLAHHAFYDGLTPIRNASGVFDESLYVPAPDDWYIAVSDVRGSTAAVAQPGRHRDVNFVASAMIAGLTNVFGQLPYQFGGDGAVTLVPPEGAVEARKILARVRGFAKRDFDLDLRVGIAPLRALSERGAAVRVGRYEPSPGSAYAVFRGGGIARLEDAVKGRGEADLAAIAVIADTEDDDEPPDLTGLSCRWTPIKSAKGSMVSLVLRCADHRQIHAELTRVVGVPALNAISPGMLKTKWPPAGLIREAKARRGRIPLPLMIVATAAITAFATFFIHFRIPIGRFDPHRYVKELKEGAVDFARADESLCVVFDCPEDRIPALKDYLEARAARGELLYGMHVSDHAVMTCLVVSPSDGQHVHFVDGGDGGYTRAATQLKAQIAKAV